MENQTTNLPEIKPSVRGFEPVPKRNSVFMRLLREADIYIRKATIILGPSFKVGSEVEISVDKENGYLLLTPRTEATPFTRLVQEKQPHISFRSKIYVQGHYHAIGTYKGGYVYKPILMEGA